MKHCVGALVFMSFLLVACVSPEIQGGIRATPITTTVTTTSALTPVLLSATPPLPVPTHTPKITPLSTLTHTPLPPSTPVRLSLPVISDITAHGVHLIHEFNFNLAIRSIAFSPLADAIAAGREDGSVLLLYWGFPLEGNSFKTEVLAGHKGPVSGVAFSPDGSIVASTSGDVFPGVLLRASQTGQELHKLSTSALSIAFSPDGGTLVSGNTDGGVSIWDIKEGTSLLQHALDPYDHDGVCSIVFSTDGASLAAGYCDYTIAIWDTTKDYELRRTIKCIKRFECPGHCMGTEPNNIIMFSPNEQFIASATFPQINVPVWNVDTGKLANVVGTQMVVSSLAYSPDGSVLAIVEWGGNILLKNAKTGLLIKALPVPSQALITSLAFSDDGKLLVSGDVDGSIQLWGVPEP